jgi:hypothetical protein
MAAKIQIKRSSVSGNAPSASNIDTGELALNLADGVLYSSNGTAIFEVGANVSSLKVNGITYPTSDGTDGQVLSTDGSGTLSFTSVSGSGEASVQQLETYTYTFTANTTVIEGQDDDSNTLQYDLGEESVFLNGVKLISGADYTTTNATAITLTDTAVEDDVIQINTFEGVSRYLTNTSSSSDTSDVNIDNFPTANYRSAKFFVTANTASEYQATEAMVIHDGTNAYMNEYGSVFSNVSIFDLSCSVSSGSVILTATPVRSGTIFKTKKLLTKV